MVAPIGRLSLIKGLGEEEKKRRGMASATATTLKGRRARSGDQEAQSICVSGRSNRSRPRMFRKARWRSHHRSDVTAASVRCGIKVRGVRNRGHGARTGQGSWTRSGCHLGCPGQGRLGVTLALSGTRPVPLHLGQSISKGSFGIRPGTRSKTMRIFPVPAHD
jgi:hypothetical protein